MLSLKVWNPPHEFPSPLRAVSSVTNKLHLVSSRFFFRLGISDKIKTEMIRIASVNIKSQKKVYLISFFV